MLTDVLLITVSLMISSMSPRLRASFCTIKKGRLDWASLSVWLICLFGPLFVAFEFLAWLLSLLRFLVFCRFFFSRLFSRVASGFMHSFCLECLSGFCTFLAVLVVLAFLAFWLLLSIIGWFLGTAHPSRIV